MLVIALGCQSVEQGTSASPPVDDSSGGEPPSTEGFTDTLEPEPEPDFGPGPAYECDPWLQDCPEGQKCSLYSPTGGHELEASRCVPLVDPPKQVDEWCVATGGYGSGVDDCDAGLICWAVSPSETGICVQLCEGPLGAPGCPKGWSCAKGIGDWHSMCLAECDPVAQDCIEGLQCYASNQGFVCAPDVSGEQGAIYDTCTIANDCDRGLMCAPPDAAPGCGAPADLGCCLPFCEVPGACVDGLECVNLYDPVELPDYATYGLCVDLP